VARSAGWGAASFESLSIEDGKLKADRTAEDEGGEQEKGDEGGNENHFLSLSGITTPN
jgi:hypothetical protein